MGVVSGCEHFTIGVTEAPAVDEATGDVNFAIDGLTGNVTFYVKEPRQARRVISR